ncbi:MAG: hypothetical protein D6714_03080 [Bacteroidetes bacterium]|nr:MAG: hypothetical protein D6714_03080 [Bacteroidota bacterium]
MNETNERKIEKPRHPKPPPRHGNGDNFSPKKIKVPLRRSLAVLDVAFLGKNEWFGWFWAPATGSLPAGFAGSGFGRMKGAAQVSPHPGFGISVLAPKFF